MKQLLVIIFLTSTVSAFAQKVKVTEGDLKPLKGQSSLKLEFVYHDMTIGKDGLAEQDYINKKKEEYNKKEAGTGDKWEKNWVADRTNRFEPNFAQKLEEFGSVKNQAESKYTLIFHTTMTEPGWNVGVMRSPARINAEVLIVETSNPSNIIAKLSVINAPGRDAWGFDYDSGLRLEEAYAKSGKEIGKLITKL